MLLSRQALQNVCKHLVIFGDVKVFRHSLQVTMAASVSLVMHVGTVDICKSKTSSDDVYDPEYSHSVLLTGVR